jgi:hypothetical protein
MMTEYEVRRQIAEVLSSDEPSMRKVRELLRVARALKLEARALLHARALSVQAQDTNACAHLDRMNRSLRMLYEEVRLAADRALAESSAVPEEGLALA